MDDNNWSYFILITAVELSPMRTRSDASRLLLAAFGMVVFLVLNRFMFWFQDFPQGWPALLTVSFSGLVSIALTIGLTGPSYWRSRPIGIFSNSRLWSRGQIISYCMFAGLIFRLYLEVFIEITQPTIDLSLSTAGLAKIILGGLVFGGLLSWVVLVRLPIRQRCNR